MLSLSCLLSEGERRYICGGIDAGLRSDGRACDHYQLISIETDVTHNCDGSAHVKCAHNDVVVGVKLEMNTLDATQQSTQTTTAGKIEFFADITANASPAFEGRKGEDISNLLVTMFTESMSSCIDLESLVVVPNQSFWVIHVDIVVLECGSVSSLIDCAAIAVKCALHNTKIPKVTILSEDISDFVVSDDVYEAINLDASRIPLFVTLTRISSQYVIDVTREEEAASISSISIAVNQNHGIVYVKKFGSGSLHPEPIKDIFEKALIIGNSLNEAINSNLRKPGNKGKLGFSIF